MSTKRSIPEYDRKSPPCNNYEYTNGGHSLTNKANLDDFIYELEQRNEEMSNDEQCQNVDQLQHLYVSSNENTTAHRDTESSLHQLSMQDTNVLIAQLAKKEKDLILAAELGKALLDRNEELSRANEQINEEYTRNLEVRTYVSVCLGLHEGVCVDVSPSGKAYTTVQVLSMGRLVISHIGNDCMDTMQTIPQPPPPLATIGSASCLCGIVHILIIS